MTKYAYSHDGETYHGQYDSPDAAAAEAVADLAASGKDLPGTKFYIGEAVTPSKFWGAIDWIEHYERQHSYNVAPEDAVPYPTDEQIAELEAEVDPILQAWLDRHELNPAQYTVENPELWILDACGPRVVIPF